MPKPKAHQYMHLNQVPMLTARWCHLCLQDRGVARGKFIRHFNNRLGGVVCANSGKTSPSVRTGRGGPMKDEN